ncbi:hypothetical protein ACOSP7_028017 [Xanthoceras sorbifolium]|uniref:Uncharacterized protein n=1 Tax=Xanthoceras sorbifolium TaxID=99658 RepID=A0ABQ8HDJ3_9ROSI|nr:hypothetical protein JRO89_XS12G0236000 [Xanthoceras sorbifolium]
MKFGKEFAAQLVQEWQEAYMDYNYLKRLLKDVLHFRQQQSTPSPMMAATTPKGSSLKRRVSLYRAFSGLTNRCSRGSPRKSEEDEEVILVSSEPNGGLSKTMFLMSSDDDGEYEFVFFRTLDDQFNKVVSFYKKKVEELVAEAGELSKQMDALIALRIKVDNPILASNGDPSFSVSVHSINGGKPGQSHMSTIQEVEMSSEGCLEEEKRGDDENGRTSDVKGFRPASLEVLDQVKINIKHDTPVSILKCVMMSKKSEMSFSKRDLKRTEELMTHAFVEFYRKLRLLKSYCFLNQLAFSKIMKKYDKITSRNASKAYLQMVDDSYLGSCDEVTKLMERVEATFVKHFANGNHSKGMDTLRPKAKRETHRITFFLGCFFGFSLALLVAIVVAMHARDVLNSPGRNQYMENIFPLYSLFGYIVLHMVMYAGNIYFWKRYRVNYSFIFGFKPGTELGYREVLLLGSVLSVLMLGGILSNLDMEMDPRTKSFEALTELVPLGLLLVVMLITFCPFKIIYHSSRFFLIRCAFHCVCAPLYKVTLPDFFLADQFTSQVQALRCLEFYVCYYGWGDFKRRSNKCGGSHIFDIFYLVAAVIPYWIRFIQSLRRLFEERDGMHGLNGLKYLSTIVAVTTRTILELRPGNTWLIVAAASSGVATIANTYWDIVIDWGLLRRNSRNPWLRDKLVIPNRSVYFIAMVLNIILRFAWMQTVLGFREAPFLHRKALVAVVASLEIIRRGIWNFFRLENEHLNNVGKYRAFKPVPLPFNYDDDDDKGV